MGTAYSQSAQAIYRACKGLHMTTCAAESGFLCMSGSHREWVGPRSISYPMERAPFSSLTLSSYVFTDSYINRSALLLIHQKYLKNMDTTAHHPLQSLAWFCFCWCSLSVVGAPFWGSWTGNKQHIFRCFIWLVNSHVPLRGSEGLRIWWTAGS